MDCAVPYWIDILAIKPRLVISRSFYGLSLLSVIINTMDTVADIPSGNLLGSY